MNRVIIYIVTAIALLLLQTAKLFAQSENNSLSVKEKSEVVDSVSSKLNANYVFPEVAKKMADKLKENVRAGAYTKIVEPQEFANQLTQDLQSVSNDKHIRVGFDPQGIAEQQQAVTAEDSVTFLNR